MMRGLRSPGPARDRADALVRRIEVGDLSGSCACRRRVPYLFTALKIAAAASIVGTIIGEGPGGVQQGLGRAIVTFNQQYITGPEKLWATILVASHAWASSSIVLVRVVEIARASHGEAA